MAPIFSSFFFLFFSFFFFFLFYVQVQSNEDLRFLLNLYLVMKKAQLKEDFTDKTKGLVEGFVTRRNSPSSIKALYHKHTVTVTLEHTVPEEHGFSQQTLKFVDSALAFQVLDTIADHPSDLTSSSD